MYIFKTNDGELFTSVDGRVRRRDPISCLGEAMGREDAWEAISPYIGTDAPGMVPVKEAAEFLDRAFPLKDQAVDKGQFSGSLAQCLRDDAVLKKMGVEVSVSGVGGQWLSASSHKYLVNRSPRIDLDGLYMRYLAERRSIPSYARMAAQSFADYFSAIGCLLSVGREGLSNRVFHRIVGTNSPFLTICPNMETYGLHAIFGILLYPDTDVAVSYALMEELGFTLEELHKLALQNTPSLFPAKVMDTSLLKGGGAKMLVISNMLGRYGLGTVLYPGIFELASMHFPGSGGLYVFPYSEDFMVVAPEPGAGEDAPWDKGRKVVPFSEPERFSNQIFYYDVGKKDILLAKDKGRR